jgi:hypothetical protein
MFRVLFGAVLAFSTLRFWVNGWIETQYIAPDFFFKYYGFHWVSCPNPTILYLLFGLMCCSALCIAVGLLYRINAVLFFLSFTYVELIDVSNYLNHYYFVSLVAFLLIFSPAHRNYSLDVKLGLVSPQQYTSSLPLLLLKAQISIVYFYAGLAKLNPDWLLHALPLKIWLPAQQHLPVIGELLTYEWVAYAFSWGGAAYDLAIPFLLWNKRTRLFAFVLVVSFHLLTWALFPIGVFPWVMILCTLVFFSASFHQKLFSLLGIQAFAPETIQHTKRHNNAAKWFTYPIAVYLFIQLLLPFRFALYPGKLFWTEQGYRFSWRVMLMEKAGYATFFVTNPANGKTTEVNPADYLTTNQLKQMATQPDLILQFAHHLAKEYKAQGIPHPEVRAKVYVTLNGKSSKLFIDPTVDLTKLSDNFAAKTWILRDA